MTKNNKVSNTKKNKVNQKINWNKKNITILIASSSLLILLISALIYSKFINNKTYAVNPLGAEHYTCPTGTTKFYDEPNDKYICYVETGIQAKCPIDVETESDKVSLQDICTQGYDELLQKNIYTPTGENEILNNKCRDRNYEQTSEDDSNYYGYFNTACVCYGGFKTSSGHCRGTRQDWLVKEVSDSDYRYYIPASEDIICENGSPIVIATDNEKGNKYACSTSDATINQYTVNVLINPNEAASSDAQSKAVEAGKDVEFTITPNEGYEYESNTCNGIYNTTTNKFIISEVLSNKTCTINFSKKKYTVTVNKDNNSTGDGTITNVINQVEHGNTVTIKVTPNSNSKYNGTTCDQFGGVYNETTSTITFTNVIENKTCTVKFAEKNKYTVTATPNDNTMGTVTVNKSQVYEGDSSTITLTPAQGYEYDIEKGNTCGATLTGNNILTINNINQNVNCVVNFKEKNSYRVTVSPENTDYGSTTPASKDVYQGENASFEITTTPGNTYKSTECVDTENNPINITPTYSSSNLTFSNITQDMVCTVKFNHGPYTVTVELRNSATGTIEKTPITVNEGENAVTKVIPKTGYTYDGTICTDSNDTTYDNSSLTIKNVKQDTTCTVEFREKSKYTITANSNNNSYGTVQVDKSPVYRDESSSITLTPAKNYEYIANDCGAVLSTDKSKLILTSIQSDTTCNVVFQEKEKYTVIAKTSNPDYGEVEPPTQEIHNGENAEITITTTDGNEYESFKCEGVENATGIYKDGKLTISGIDKNTTCTINYKEVNEYTIKASSENEEQGKVTPDNQTTKPGGDAIITVNPEHGYEYNSNDCGAVYDNGILTLSNITSNKTCKITFKEKEKHTIEANSSNDSQGTVIVDKDIVYDGEDSTIILNPALNNVYDSNDCGAIYDNGILTLKNVTSDIKCTINFKNIPINVSNSIPDITTNVQTGNKSYLIYIICLLGGVGIIFGYKKIKKTS